MGTRARPEALRRPGINWRWHPCWPPGSLITPANGGRARHSQSQEQVLEHADIGAADTIRAAPRLVDLGVEDFQKAQTRGPAGRRQLRAQRLAHVRGGALLGQPHRVHARLGRVGAVVVHLRRGAAGLVGGAVRPGNPNLMLKLATPCPRCARHRDIPVLRQ